jgi:hypothetical protein
VKPEKKTWLGNSCVTMEYLLEAVFSVRSVPKPFDEDQLPLVDPGLPSSKSLKIGVNKICS